MPNSLRQWLRYRYLYPPLGPSLDRRKLAMVSGIEPILLTTSTYGEGVLLLSTMLLFRPRHFKGVVLHSSSSLFSGTN